MPATQSVEFGASAGQTVTAKLFAAGSDTVVQTASAVTAATNRTGVYTATFTDVAAGTYRLIATNAAGTLLAQWWVDLTLTTATFQAYEMPVTGFGTAVLESRLTATRAGYLDSVLLAQNSNQRTVQVTGSNHVASDVHAFQADVIDAAAIAASAVTELQSGLATAANLLIVSDRVSYGLAVLVGACSDAQTAAETYTLSIGGNTFTVDYSGLDASGNRSTTTLSKT